MIHADTEGLLDRCHCGAVAGFEYTSDNTLMRARCTDCCEQTKYHIWQEDTVIDWNLARRAEKAAKQ